MLDRIWPWSTITRLRTERDLFRRLNDDSQRTASSLHKQLLDEKTLNYALKRQVTQMEEDGAVTFTNCHFKGEPPKVVKLKVNGS